MASSEPWWLIREPTFKSDVPILGRFFAWFRRLWNSVATVWYVRPMLAQQNAVNARVVSELKSLALQLDALREETSVAESIVVRLDREQLDAQRTALRAIYALADEVAELREKVADLERASASREGQR